MRAIVTGGAGFIGSNLVDQLIEDGHDVAIIDNLSNGKRENINPKADFYDCDIRFEEVQPLLENADIVFHLAAMARVQPSIENPLEFDMVNTHGTLNLLEGCKKYGVKRFVFSSSSSVYGTPHEDVLEGKRGLSESIDGTAPLSPYGLQKLLGEEYCRLYSRIHGIKTACLRYFNVYGERQSIEGAYKLVMGIFAEQRMNGEPLSIIGDGTQKRDFTYVKDVVQANILAGKFLESEVESEVFNIGHGDNRSVNEIAALFGGETVNLPPRVEPKCTLADNSKARELLGWKPTISVDDWVPTWISSLRPLKTVEWRLAWKVTDWRVRNVVFNPSPNRLVEWDCDMGSCYGTTKNKFYWINEGKSIEFDGITLGEMVKNLSSEEYGQWIKVCWKRLGG